VTIRNVLNFINGEFTEGASGKTFEVRNPVDNSVTAQVHEAGSAEAMDGPWGAMTVDARVALLNKVADRINERFDEFLEAECLDTGKPRSPGQPY
jgi:aminomuconate-semialdehyde/2-hydroxymuconate-6-semialdehyde dehydrogenase